MERLLRAPRGLSDGIALHLEVCAPKQTLARRPEIRCPVPGLLHEQARARQGGGGGIRAAVGSGQFEPLISSISNFLATLAIRGAAAEKAQRAPANDAVGLFSDLRSEDG